MRRVVLLGLGLVALIGCDPGKEAPTFVPVASNRGPAEPDPVPTTSDPAAKAFVEACIKAATDGHPERLDKGKAYQARLSGLILGQDRRTNPASRELKAVWPDKFLMDQESAAGEVKRVVIGLRRPSVWAVRTTAAGTEDFTPENQKEYAANVFADVVGENWLPTLVPLADPTTVAFDARPQELAGHRVDTVKAAIPGCPVYTLWFDPPTKLLGLVTFTHRELTVTYQKRVRVSGHTARNGVLLPSKIEFARNTLTMAEWTVVSWDFVGAIDDTAFDPPAAVKK